MSVPAQAARNTQPHRHPSVGVTTPRTPVVLVADAAMNGAVSDRAVRVYVVIATGFAHTEVDVPTLTTFLPLSEHQVRNAVGELVAAGLIERKPLKVVGYNEGRRIRRHHYRLVGGAR